MENLILAMFPLSIYMAPTIIALSRGSHVARSVFWINLAFGWTLIGWIAAWVILIRAERQRTRFIAGFGGMS
jgi:uncharacterized membrane protein